MMDEVVDEFADAVGELSPAPPRIPYVSNVTGDWITAEQATSPEYWAQQLRRSVRFADGLRPLLADPGAILLEVGPGQTLCTFARRHPDRDDAQLVLPSLPRPQESVADDALALETLGRLWLAGVPVDWQGMHAGTRRRRVHLPVYPFERRRYWADAEEPERSGPPIVLKEPDVGDWFYVPTWEYALVPTQVPPTEQEQWLVFGESDGLGSAVAGRLLDAGHDVTVVLPGDGFAARDGWTFTIDCGRRSDYEALFERLADENRLPQNILHLWCVGEPEAALSDARAARLLAAARLLQPALHPSRHW